MAESGVASLVVGADAIARLLQRRDIELGFALYGETIQPSGIAPPFDEVAVPAVSERVA